MIFVLADDFSGAAEIAGIGHRYGLRTEIQLNLDIDTRADLVVLDTDTRSLSEAEATQKIFEVGTALKKWRKPFYFFKKIDSVMRGHLIPELNALHECFNFNRILLLPANPARGRKIIAGEYFINGTTLNQTVFAKDPDFPVVSSGVSERIGSYTPSLKHFHISPTDTLPISATVTGDIQSKLDLKKYVAGIGSNDLCCGAAELFESFLEHYGFSPRINKANEELRNKEFMLIINGSTVKHQIETDLYERLHILQFSLPVFFNDREFQIRGDEAIVWFQEVLDALHAHHVAVVAIDHPVEHNKILSDKFLKYFNELMAYITRYIALNKIHFCITGGATASVLIRYFTEGKLRVRREIAPGVVSLAMVNQNSQWEGCFTVKPGSYIWPSQLIEGFFSKESPI